MNATTHAQLSERLRRLEGRTPKHSDLLVTLTMLVSMHEDGSPLSTQHRTALDLAALSVRMAEAIEAEDAAEPTGADLIAAERARQMSAEGWTPEHDDKHGRGELAEAAACYIRTATTHVFNPSGPPPWWPWASEWWKPCPDDRVRELAKAGALIAAENEGVIVEIRTIDDSLMPETVLYQAWKGEEWVKGTATADQMREWYGARVQDMPAEVEPMDPEAPVYCEACDWSGVEGDCYKPAMGCVCPECDDAFSVTAGVRPVTVNVDDFSAAADRRGRGIEASGLQLDGDGARVAATIERWSERGDAPAKPAPEWHKTGQTWRLHLNGMPVVRIDGVVATRIGVWRVMHEPPCLGADPYDLDAAVAQVIEWGLEQSPTVVVPPLPCAECGGAGVALVPIGDGTSAEGPCLVCTPAPDETAVPGGGWRAEARRIRAEYATRFDARLMPPLHAISDFARAGGTSVRLLALTEPPTPETWAMWTANLLAST